MPEGDYRLNSLTPSWKDQLRAKAKEMLIDEEVRRRKYVTFTSTQPFETNSLLLGRAVKMNLANEGLEARKKEEEVSAKKRKAEEDANWEGKFSCWPCSLRG